MKRVERKLTPEEELARRVEDARLRITHEEKRTVYAEWASQEGARGANALGPKDSWKQCVEAVGEARIEQMNQRIEERLAAWKVAEGISEE